MKTLTLHLALLLCLLGNAYGQDAKKPLNEKYSYRDLSIRTMDSREIPVEELNNTTIKGSGFGRRVPYGDCFPKDMTGVVFIDCNLDNCVAPEGNTVIGGTNKQHAVMNDGENWIVDKDLKPVEPLKPYRFDAYNLSKDPADIPLVPLKESVTTTASKAVAE